MTKRGREIWATFTERERKIATEVLTNPGTLVEIAEGYGTTTQGLKNTMRSVYEKCGAENRYAFMIVAYREGLVPCPCRGNVDA